MWKGMKHNCSFFLRKYKKILFLLLFGSVILFRYWLSSTQMLIAVGGSWFDDMLFIKLANALIHGEWLGKYSEMTLAKGPMYPMFIAFSNFSHIPLLQSQQVLYIFATCLLFFALKKKYNTACSFIVFLFVLFNPFSYQIAERVTRHHFYSSLTIGTVACIFGLLASEKQRSFKHALWALGFGIFSAMFYLTREEFMWFIPLYLVPIGHCLSTYIFRKHLHPVFFRTVLFGYFVGILFVCIVSCVNKFYYGTFVINELKQSAYTKVYGDLIRIKQETPIRHATISKLTLHKAALVSPHFKIVEELINETYRTSPHKSSFTIATNEISGANLIFDIRDAAFRLGYYPSYKIANTFFQEIHKELVYACKNKSLECTAWPFDLIPQFHMEYSVLFLQSVTRLVFRIPSLDTIGTLTNESTGDIADIDLTKSVTGHIVTTKYHSDQETEGSLIQSTGIHTVVIGMFQRLFRMIGCVLFSIGILCFIVTIRHKIVTKNMNKYDLFIIGMGMSMMFLITLISYIESICFELDALLYVSPVYPLMGIFSLCMIYEVVLFFKKTRKNHKKNYIC